MNMIKILSILAFSFAFTLMQNSFAMQAAQKAIYVRHINALSQNVNPQNALHVLQQAQEIQDETRNLEPALANRARSLAAKAQRMLQPHQPSGAGTLAPRRLFDQDGDVEMDITGLAITE